ncbi:MAG: hypothetical protein OQK65_01555, partial [Chlorobium sp.]|nr:hypothetical protein [Chlorobium sp.]
MDWISVLRGFLGILLLLAIAFVFSNNKSKINWRLVLGGIGLQFVFAILILKSEDLRSFFSPLGWPKDFFNWI